MRKIISKQKEAKRRKGNQLIVGLILIFIMFFSVLGYAFGGGGGDATEDSNKVVYNGFEFENQNGLWVLNRGNFIFAFIYNPEQVEEIYANVNTLDKYYQKPLYISSEDSEAEIEIARNIGQVALRMQPACLEWQNCTDQNIPTKTCEDNFIIIREDDVPYIIQEENCVFIKGPKEDLLKLTDQFLFKTMGIT